MKILLVQSILCAIDILTQQLWLADDHLQFALVNESLLDNYLQLINTKNTTLRLSNLTTIQTEMEIGCELAAVAKSPQE